MRKIIFSGLFALATMLFIGSFGITNAEAQKKCTGTACGAAHWATRAPAVGGPKAPTRERMACVRVVSYGYSEIIWVEGNTRNYVNGRVIAKQRAAAAHNYRFPLNNGWSVTESCIPQRLLQGVRELTLCNGDRPGIGYHWQVSGETLQRLKGRSGHPGTYLPLLKTVDKNTLSPDRVRAAYRAKHGA